MRPKPIIRDNPRIGRIPSMRMRIVPPEGAIRTDAIRSDRSPTLVVVEHLKTDNLHFFRLILYSCMYYYCPWLTPERLSYRRI
jgi:hypothetical protein